MKYLIALSLTLITACAHNPNRAEVLDTQMTITEPVQDGSIGIKNEMMIYQKKTSAAEDLRDLQIQVYTLEDRVYGNRKFGSLGLYGVLRDCHNKLSDPTNGGTGQGLYLEPIDRITDKPEIKKIGLDGNKKLIGLTEEMLLDRINKFTEYKTTLEKRQDEYEENIEICNMKLNSNKYKVGAK